MSNEHYGHVQYVLKAGDIGKSSPGSSGFRGVTFDPTTAGFSICSLGFLMCCGMDVVTGVSFSIASFRRVEILFGAISTCNEPIFPLRRFLKFVCFLNAGGLSVIGVC
mmetsp:Transcript_12451/g.19789  ORF Transcript_12451/g.19789 Transcript_12451/m.19789 type:complete len:108 (-) Transcript_12451:937-1260(-)